jgi:hypothetical protein
VVLAVPVVAVLAATEAQVLLGRQTQAVVVVDADICRAMAATEVLAL